MEKQSYKFIMDSFHSEHSQYQQKQQVPTDPLYLAQYQSFFERIPLCEISQYQDKLSSANIQYHPDKFFSEPNFTWLYESSSFKIIILQVEISYFSLKLQIINLERPSLGLNKLKELAHGSFGEIYLIKDENNKTYALKCIRYKESTQRNQQQKMNISVRNGLVELCFYKLFSCLDIGPLYVKPFGFDCIIYSNGLQFAIEYCEPIKIERTICDLKSKMKLMHSLKIIHGDMKIENVMYSPSRKSNVLIDFNCSKSIDEQQGFKTLTKFHGTFWYSSADMKELAVSRQSKHIDEYYNDLNGLLELSKQGQIEGDLQKSKKLQNIEQLLNFSQINTVSYIMIKLQFFIFKRQQNNARHLLTSLKSIRQAHLASTNQTYRKRKTSTLVQAQSCEFDGKKKFDQESLTDLRGKSPKILGQMHKCFQILEIGQLNEIQLKKFQEQVQFNELVHETLQIFLQFSVTKSLALMKQMIFQELASQLNKSKSNSDDTINNVKRHIQVKKRVLPVLNPQRIKFQNRFWLIGGQKFFENKGEPYVAVYNRKKTRLQENCFSLIFKIEEQFILQNYKFIENTEPLPGILASLEKQAFFIKPSEKMPEMNTQKQGKFLSLFYKAITSAECNNQLLSRLLLIFQKKYPKFYLQMTSALTISWEEHELDTNKKIRLIIKYLGRVSDQPPENLLEEVVEFRNLKRRRVQNMLSKLQAKIKDEKPNERIKAYQILCQKLQILVESPEFKYYQNLQKIAEELQSIQNYHDERSLAEIKAYIQYLLVQPFMINNHTPQHILSRRCENLVNWLHSKNMEESSIYENIKLLHCFLNLFENKVVKTYQTYKQILEANLKFNRQAFVLIHILGQFLKLNFIESHKNSKNYMQFWKTDSTQDFITGLRNIWKVTISSRQKIMFTSALLQFSNLAKLPLKIDWKKYQQFEMEVCMELKFTKEILRQYCKNFKREKSNLNKSFKEKTEELKLQINLLNQVNDMSDQALMIKSDIIELTQEAVNGLKLLNKTGMPFLSDLQSVLQKTVNKVCQNYFQFSMTLVIPSIYSCFQVLYQLNQKIITVDTKPIDSQGELFVKQIRNKIVSFVNLLKACSSFFQKNYIDAQHFDHTFFSFPIYSMMLVQFIKAKEYKIVKNYFLHISKQVHKITTNYAQNQSFIINYYLWTMRIFIEASFCDVNQQIIFEFCEYMGNVSLSEISQEMYLYLVVFFVVLKMVVSFFAQKILVFVEKTQIIQKIIRLLKFNSSFIRNRVKVEWYPFIIKIRSISKLNVLVKAIRSPEYRVITAPFYNYLVSKLEAKDSIKKKILILSALSRKNNQKKVNSLERSLDLMKEAIVNKMKIYKLQRKKQFNFNSRLEISIAMHRIYWGIINSRFFPEDKTIFGILQYS